MCELSSKGSYLASCSDILSVTGIDDDTTRRDSMHAIINSLPDPNYATLRALTLVSILLLGPTEYYDADLNSI